jgi:hypothetical protein
MTIIATAYDRKPGTHDPDLTEVGRGTPMGELMRRYWQPVGIAEDATDLPKMVRALGWSCPSALCPPRFVAFLWPR